MQFTAENAVVSLKWGGWGRDYCILGQAFITLSPISDVFDNIEYFSALNKWFNFDIIEK